MFWKKISEKLPKDQRSAFFELLTKLLILVEDMYTQLIGDLKELSILKMTGELSKIYRYRENITYHTPLAVAEAE